MFTILQNNEFWGTGYDVYQIQYLFVDKGFNREAGRNTIKDNETEKIYSFKEFLEIYPL